MIIKILIAVHSKKSEITDCMTAASYPYDDRPEAVLQFVGQYHLDRKKFVIDSYIPQYGTPEFEKLYRIGPEFDFNRYYPTAKQYDCSVPAHSRPSISAPAQARAP